MFAKGPTKLQMLQDEVQKTNNTHESKAEELSNRLSLCVERNVLDQLLQPITTDLSKKSDGETLEALAKELRQAIAEQAGVCEKRFEELEKRQEAFEAVCEINWRTAEQSLEKQERSMKELISTEQLRITRLEQQLLDLQHRYQDSSTSLEESHQETQAKIAALELHTLERLEQHEALNAGFATKADVTALSGECSRASELLQFQSEQGRLFVKLSNVQDDFQARLAEFETSVSQQRQVTDQEFADLRQRAREIEERLGQSARHSRKVDSEKTYLLQQDLTRGAARTKAVEDSVQAILANLPSQTGIEETIQRLTVKNVARSDVVSWIERHREELNDALTAHQEKLLKILESKADGEGLDRHEDLITSLCDKLESLCHPGFARGRQFGVGGSRSATPRLRMQCAEQKSRGQMARPPASPTPTPSGFVSLRPMAAHYALPQV